MKNIIFVVILLLFACQEKQADKGVVLGDGESLSFTSFVDSVFLLPLGIDSLSLIGRIDKVITLDSCYYFLDSEKTNSIYKFDNKGVPLRQFNRVGRGAGEYIRVYDFDIDSVNRKLVILCAPDKIFVTDLDFNIEKTITVRENPSRIACADNLVYLYSHVDRSLSVFNQNTSELKKICVENNLAQVFFRSLPVFHKLSGQLLYTAIGSDKIFALKKGEIQLLFPVDYPQKEQKLRRMGESKPLSMRDALLLSPPSIFRIFKIGNDYAMFYSYEAMVRLCVFDSESGVMKSDGIMENWKGGFEIDYAGKSLVTWEFMPDGKLAENFSGYKYSLRHPLFNDDEGNPVLIQYLLKDSIFYE